jgi:hypothetical protein
VRCLSDGARAVPPWGWKSLLLQSAVAAVLVAAADLVYGIVYVCVGEIVLFHARRIQVRRSHDIHRSHEWHSLSAGSLCPLRRSQNLGETYVCDCAWFS